MKKMFGLLVGALLCSFTSMAQVNAVQFGQTAQAEATFEKVAPLLNSPGLADVDALCKQVAADGLNDALVRTKLFILGQAVSMKGPSAKHLPALEALFAKYAKESASPVQQLFFIEQLRWIGTKQSMPVILALCKSTDVNVAASANMTRQSIERTFDPATLVYPKTQMRELGEALDKANEAEKFRLLSAAVATKGDLAYQAFAIEKIEKPLSSEVLSKWCDVARKSKDPLVKCLLLRVLGSQQGTTATELLLDMCGQADATVSAAALEALAQRDPKTLQEALPTRLANVKEDNYKAFAAFLSTLPASVTVPALTAALPKQNALGKRLIFETLAPHPGSATLVAAAMEAATAPGSDVKLATAAFRYLRQTAGASECEKLLASVSAMKGNVQSEAVQAYALAARRPGNEVYGERLLQALKAAGATPSEALLDAAGRTGTPALLAHVSSLAASSKDAVRTLSAWRDGLAAPALMLALAQKPEDAFLLRSVRQQLQATKASRKELQKGLKALETCQKIAPEDLRDFAKSVKQAPPEEPEAAPDKPTPAAGKRAAPDAEGFYTLFDGTDLDAWIGNKVGYTITDNQEIFVDPSKGGKGDLYTAEQYGDFVLRFEFKLTPGANNGIGVRTPLNVNAAYEGFEIQVLEDTHSKYATLQPYQFHGSVYGVIPAKRGAQKPVGEWNTEEILMDGRHVKVTVNGKVIVDADLDEASKNGTMDKKSHPGLKRTMGHISFCGHGDKLWYRNIKVKPIVRQSNTPPPGWTQLFNGKDLANWKGVTKKDGFDNPLKRAAATPELRKEMQALADQDANLHWTIKDGVLCFDGKGFSLATAKDYGDFEMWCDWRLLTKKGDSGLYLRGSPQVQIWDAHHQWHIGSGGLYNNKKNPSKALLIADNPIGEWNTFYIRMIGEKVDVYLNGKCVVDNVILENYWDRKIPIFPKGQIELQCHGDPIEFKNIFIREL